MHFCSLTWFGNILLGVHVVASVEILHEWKYIDYVWNSEDQREKAINSGSYNVNACIPFDMDQAQDGRMFVTVVRNQGVPASLTTVSDKDGPGGPLLTPYPDWSWYETGECGGITSVYRVAIECNHLYVLDCGKIGDDKVCSAQLLIFDLSYNQLINRVVIPDDVAANVNGTGLLTNIVVDTNGRCRDVADSNVVYMADTEGYGLVVWEAETARFSRIESSSLDADPNADTFTVNGDSFQIADGLLGMALSRNFLFFRPLASYNMYFTKVNRLLRSTNSPTIFKEPTRLKSQSAAQAFSNEGILFFSGSTEMSILCWNRHKPFVQKNIVTVLQDSEVLQFASGMKTFDDGLYVMTNRYQKVAAGTVDFKDVNFRIIFGNIRKLVRHTNCNQDEYP